MLRWKSLLMIEREKLIEIQKRISKNIRLKPFTKKIKKIAVFDISFDKDKGYCAGILLDEKLNIIQKEFLVKTASFPYIPTFLAFRELEFIDKVFKKMSKPDIVLIDGHGLTHPRRCGIAVHFGVKNKIPTIGVAKSHLYGIYKKPKNKKFSYEYIYDENKEKIGAVLITKENSKPVYVSPGNLIDIKSALKIVKSLTRNYRIPVPLRLAHIESNKIRLCN